MNLYVLFMVCLVLNQAATLQFEDSVFFPEQHHNNLLSRSMGTCVWGTSCSMMHRADMFAFRRDTIDFHECENASLLMILIIYMLLLFLCVTMTEL